MLSTAAKSRWSCRVSQLAVTSQLLILTLKELCAGNEPRLMSYIMVLPNIDAVKPLAPFTFPSVKAVERICKHPD